MGIYFEIVLRPINGSDEQMNTGAERPLPSVPSLCKHSPDLRTKRFVL